MKIHASQKAQQRISTDSDILYSSKTDSAKLKTRHFFNGKTAKTGCEIKVWSNINQQFYSKVGQFAKRFWEILEGKKLFVGLEEKDAFLGVLTCNLIIVGD